MGIGKVVEKLATAAAGNFTGSTFNFQLPDNERGGSYQIEIGGTGSITLTLEGRMSPEAPWATLASIGAKSAGTDEIATFSPAMPEMRVSGASASGSPTTTMWVMA